jgi:hypothetical protein
MKKQPLLLALFLGVLPIFLFGCHSLETPTPAPTFTPTLTNTITPTSKPTSTPTVTPTFTPTATPTLVPISFDISVTTFDQPGKWNLTLPFIDPSLPDLIYPSQEGYRLDPDLQLDRIDLSYEWWGMGEAVLDIQRIERRGTRYWRGDAGVSAESVKSLIRSIDRLYPQPQMLSTITHTDDYPIWAVELTSVEGHHVLLYSTSNGPKFAPWNVIYNGRIYSQFNGEIGDAVNKLFRVSEGQPMAWVYEGGGEEGYTNVDTAGWPGQLSNGFSGLLAVQSNFNYWPDPQKGELRGYFRGRSSIGGFGNMIIGSITDLHKIELEVEEDQVVDCPLEVLPSNDPAEYIWEFRCPVGPPVSQSDYRYPVQITFGTDQEKTHTVDGELSGYWDQGFVLPALPLPEEIEKILGAEPVVQDLLKDHLLLVLEFNAAVDDTTNLMGHRWSADIVLLGQAKIDDRVLPYTVTLEVGVWENELLFWDLDRIKLQDLLHDVLNQPVTRHFLEGDSDLILNLYYSENSDYAIFRSISACADLPTAAKLPNSKQPLRAFAFNQSWDFWSIQILMIDGKLRIWELEIHPSWPEDAIWTSLLPAELVPSDAPPFTKIRSSPWGPNLYAIWDDENLSEEDNEAYMALLRTWPGQKKQEKTFMMLESGMLHITPDGRLKIISCK